MRLLQIHGSDKLSLVELLPDNLPPYAILSHTWGPPNEEVTYQDFLDGKVKRRSVTVNSYDADSKPLRMASNTFGSTRVVSTKQAAQSFRKQ